MKFAHITDAQLGYRQYGLAEREADFNNAFINAVDTALAESVNAVIFGGDMFEFTKPPGNVVQLMKDQVDRLTVHGIRVIGVEGNHDISNGHWLSVCGIHDLERRGPLIIDGVKFGGIGYRRDSAFMPALLEYLENADEKLDVLVLHQGIMETTPFTECSGKAVIETAEEFGHRLKYMAMGHIHKSYAVTIDDVPVVCPGSLEMTDIDEPREKFIAVVEISAGGIPDAALRPVKTRPVLYHNVYTDDELEAAINDLKKTEDPSLLVAGVSGDIVHGQERLRMAAEKAGLPYRISPLKGSAGLSAADAEKEDDWDRKKAVVDLVKYVDRSFKDMPEDLAAESRSLVKQIIVTPERAEQVMNEWIQNKLTEIGYA